MGFWASLSTAKRVALLVVTLGVLVGVLAIAGVGSIERQGYLFTELTPEDAAAVAEKLNELKIPHEIEANGTAITVSHDRVHALRLELASAGLPRGGSVGFEIFDQSHLGATEFEQQVNLRRALEGELGRSIRTIDGVQNARVHLVMAERRLFVARDEQASASVVLQLNKGVSFGKAEVAGIVHLVASAVPGLQHEGVSVVNTDGLTLHRPNADGSTAGGGSDLQAEQSREVALKMEDLARSLLERAVGRGKADVRVHVDLDAATRERTEEHYEPSQTALRSEHKVEESAAGEGATVAGVPGAQTNLPDGDPEFAPPEEELAAGAGGLVRRSQTRNWEVDRVTEKVRTPAGRINRVSVAVLMDGNYEEKEGALTYVPRSKEELERFGEIVKSAVGFNAERGDQIRIENAEFAKLDGFDDDVAPPVPLYQQHWKYLAIAGGVLVVLLAIIVLLWRRGSKGKAQPAKVKALEQGALLAELEAAGMPGVAGQLASGLDYRAKALEIAEHDPATAAVILRRWLNSAEATGVADSARS